ncbi:MAG: HI0074 family nucleotidyltransferase substrate-binding subunit [Gammaproteobacteria bacterium]|nr:HI0074 family nucleotidyltransferase substrate-binding subunit [Gammaproteobacteria bacterium]
MSTEKLKRTQAQLEKALIALKQMIDKPMQEDRSNIDACIQRFEFSVELFWKFLRRVLEGKGLLVLYPKEVIREAYAGGLIDNEALWLGMLQDRNLTSHSYNEELADEIFEHIPAYYQAMWQVLLKGLK